MDVANDTVVTIDYTLTGPDGAVIDSSVGKEPLPYLHGHGALISGLEKELAGKKAGDRLTIKVSPEEAYGVRDESLLQVVPKSAFQGVPNLEPGMQFRTEREGGAGGGGGNSVVTVMKVEGDNVTVDGNHPLSGMPLTFDVTIKDVRAATKEEIAHGHVHGAGAHHQH